jgi:hypothetical protein
LHQPILLLVSPVEYPDYVFDDINQVQKLVYQALTHPRR